jgi:putative transposase
MQNLAVLFIHFIAVLARLLGPGGVRSLIAESLLLKHQILILNRSRKRSPNLHVSDRILAGLLALLVRPTRLLRSSIVLKPSTLLALHKFMSKGKYRMLFSLDRRRQPGPKSPSAELIRAVVDVKQRNSKWGCPRIAQQMALAFHIQIDKDVVRRILVRHYRQGQDSDGPSWLTFRGHMKDSLWSMDLFRCESATLRTHWVLVVMDQYTRRIIGFGVHAGTLNGVALCNMFNRAIRGQRWMPKYLSSDNDPRYRFHQWQANLRILEMTEIKSIPYVPLSHPFVERPNGTLGASTWITLCSGRRRISKTSCSISGPTSTTIARIPHGKGERRIRPCHGQSPISTRLNGNLIVGLSIRHQWQPDFSRIHAHCGIRSTSAKILE